MVSHISRSYHYRVRDSVIVNAANRQTIPDITTIEAVTVFIHSLYFLVCHLPADLHMCVSRDAVHSAQTKQVKLSKKQRKTKNQEQALSQFNRNNS